MDPASSSPRGGRLILDTSGLVRWTGSPVGIIRVEHAVASHARDRRPDVVLGFYDRLGHRYRRLEPRWADLVTGWHGAIDMVGRDFRRRLPRWRRLLSPRYPLLMALERRRLTARSPLVAFVAGQMQRALLAPRPGDWPFADPSGRRLAIVPFDLAVGGDLAPGPDDVVLAIGSDWTHKDVAALGALKRRAGFRLVVLCFDIIPVLHPEFFPADVVAQFRRHWLAMFALSDRIIFNARRIEADARAFCAAEGVAIGATQVVPLGYEPPPADAPMRLRPGLEPGRFALFVSTIEPRKGHRLLVEVWRRLLARGVPQHAGFKLVFVGRRGWMVDDLLSEIGDAAAFDFTLLHLADSDDAELAGLYRAAAFCLYPSVYEGFGLPIIEAFSHGKAVIASTGGAVPETVGGLSPCLDAADPAAWEAMLARWIEDPLARAGYEARIRDGFSHPSWPEAAAALLAAAEATSFRADGSAPR